MRRLAAASAALAAMLATGAAHGQLFRTYLASYGSDGNLCTLVSPCRHLPTALANVAEGGEIWMLDSANYNTGTVDITKSVTILAVPGALGSVVAAGGPAIGVATAGVKAVLRNLVIVPLPGAGGTDGIVMTAGSGLTVENCLIANLPGAGISVSGAAVRISNTTIRDNGVYGVWLEKGARATVTRAIISGNAASGIFAYGTLAGSTTTADIADSTMDTNQGDGVTAFAAHATATVRVSVSNSRIVRSGFYGAYATSGFGSPSILTVSDSMIANSYVAGIAGTLAGTRVWASGNTVSDNNYGLVSASGALFESAGDNAVRNNFSGETEGTIVPIARK